MNLIADVCLIDEKSINEEEIRKKTQSSRNFLTFNFNFLFQPVTVLAYPKMNKVFRGFILTF